MIKIGDNAPLFSLPDKDGINRSLEEFRGNWVILYFYPKDNTPGCTQEACDFSLNIVDFESLKATVIGISGDSVDSHKKFAEKYNLKIILLSDQKHYVLKKYMVWKKKSFMGKAFLGIVRTTFLIDPEGKIAHIWENVSVKGHIAEVKTKLEELKRK
jgi:peroxiredoxin Q/BCP